MVRSISFPNQGYGPQLSLRLDSSDPAICSWFHQTFKRLGKVSSIVYQCGDKFIQASQDRMMLLLVASLPNLQRLQIHCQGSNSFLTKIIPERPLRLDTKSEQIILLPYLREFVSKNGGWGEITGATHLLNLILMPQMKRIQMHKMSTRYSDKIPPTNECKYSAPTTYIVLKESYLPEICLSRLLMVPKALKAFGYETSYSLFERRELDIPMLRRAILQHAHSLKYLRLIFEMPYWRYRYDCKPMSSLAKLTSLTHLTILPFLIFKGRRYSPDRQPMNEPELLSFLPKSIKQLCLSYTEDFSRLAPDVCLFIQPLLSGLTYLIQYPQLNSCPPYLKRNHNHWRVQGNVKLRVHRT